MGRQAHVLLQVDPGRSQEALRYLTALPAVTDAASTGAAWLLAAAVAATGMRSPMHALLGSGVRPLVVILAATATALALSLAAAWVLFQSAMPL